ncbi:MAG: hypothetical protein SOT19_05630 [Muribaculaceae bacterium]|nr:hypothetical protein [Muribaculaceae bacterium]
MTLRKAHTLILAALAAVALQGCFTGVESTPVITDRDIRHREEIATPEKQFLADAAPQSPRHWQAGKRLWVTDNRISLLFTPGVDGAAARVPDSLAGTVLRFADVSDVPGLTEDPTVQLAFTDSSGNRLVYRPTMTRRAFNADSSLQIPFTVDMDMVGTVRNRLVGNTYYILTPRRFRADGSEVKGLRYVTVRITDVTPGNANYPLRVTFTEEGVADTLGLYMTVGNSRIATRNFETLFSFTDPRKQYPSIEDDTWALIRQSRIREGMTPDECRLALGAPLEYLHLPSTAGMVERWSYGDGTYLFFEDGRLSRFRK